MTISRRHSKENRIVVARRIPGKLGKLTIVNASGERHA
jgi:hypothetical protein